jgi:hypothetical protein
VSRGRMISPPDGERRASMAVLEHAAADELLTRVERYAVAPEELVPPARRPRPVRDAPVVSPELVLVAPPEVADAAREALPEPVPFDDWLRRVRAREAETERYGHDWEYRPSRRSSVVGYAFALVLAASSALPVLLLVLDRSG